MITSSPEAIAFQTLGITDEPGKRVERLPFRVRHATQPHEIEQIAALRHAAYARHLPEFAERLHLPEESDFDAGSTVLFAESKLDNSVLGTMRIQTNRYSALHLEESVTLPDWLQGKSLAEATRLAVTDGSRLARLVKVALFKAYFLYCQEAGIDWMVITARPPLDRQYEALLFQDIMPDGQLVAMKHVGDIPHRLLAFDVNAAERRWIECQHPLFAFMCNISHPDIICSAMERCLSHLPAEGLQGEKLRAYA